MQANTNLSGPWGWLFLSCGVCLIGTGLWLWMKLGRSKHWPKTTGIIRSAKTEIHWRTTGGTRYMIVKPEVVYDYDVNDKNYSGTGVAIIEDESSFEDANRGNAQKYSAGQQVDVFFDPQNPAKATLSVGDATDGILPFTFLIVGFLLVIVGACLF